MKGFLCDNKDLQARRLKDNSITLGAYLENVGAVNIKSDRLYIRTAERGPIENGDINIETINGQCILPLDISSNDQISHWFVSRRSVSFVPARATPIKRKSKKKSISEKNHQKYETETLIIVLMKLEIL